MTITLFDPRTGKPVTITVPDGMPASAPSLDALRSWTGGNKPRAVTNSSTLFGVWSSSYPFCPSSIR